MRFPKWPKRTKAQAPPGLLPFEEFRVLVQRAATTNMESRLNSIRVGWLGGKQPVSHPGLTTNDLTYSWRIPRLFASYNHIATAATGVPLELRELKPEKGPGGGGTLVAKSSIVRARKVVGLLAEEDRPAFLHKKSMELEPVADNHPLRVLLDKVNKGQTWAELIYLTMFDLDAAGNAYWELAGGAGGKQPGALFRIRPDLIKAKGDGSGYVVTQNGKPLPLDAGEVLHFRYPHPMNDFYGLARGEVLERVLQTEDGRIDYGKAFFEHGTMLGGLLVPSEGMTDTMDMDTVTALYDEYVEQHTGVKNMGKVMLAGGLQYKETGHTPKDAEYLGLASRDDTEIASVTGVPAATFDAKLTNRASLDTIKAQFWSDTMTGKLAFVSGILTEFLCTRYSEGLIASFDLSGVTALQESLDSQLVRVRSVWEAGQASGDELRDAAGLSALPDGAGQVYLRKANEFLVRIGEAVPQEKPAGDTQAAQDATQESTGGTGGATPAKPAGGAGGAGAATPGGTGSLPLAAAVTQAVQVEVVRAAVPFASREHRRFLAEWEDRLGENEELLAGRIAEWARELEKQVIGKVGTRETKATAPSVQVLFDRDAEGEKLWDLIVRTGGEVGAAEAQVLAGELGLAKLAFDTNNPEVRKHFREAALFVKSIPEDIHDDLRAILDTSARNGWPITKLTEAIRQRFDMIATSQAATIAQTEMVGAMNVTRAASIEDLGMGRRWIATLDDKVRDSHAFVHGEVRFGKKPFSNGLMYPGQAGAPAAERIRCRCALAAVQPQEGEVGAAEGASPVPAVTQPAGLPKFNAGGKWDAAEMQREEARLAKLLDQANVAEAAEETKARIAKALAKRLENDEVWLDSVCNNFWLQDAYYDEFGITAAQTRAKWLAKGYTEAEIKTRMAEFAEERADELIRMWAGTSGDNNATAIAMQLAAKDEFGLDTATLGHFLTRQVEEAQTYYATQAPGLRAFLRAQYDETQEWLAKEGIEDVLVYRGMGLTEAEFAAVKAAGDKGVARIGLQPMSSFSGVSEEALSFVPEDSGGVLTVRVPKERILGSAQTGYGCKNEAEFVVLGGRDEVRVIIESVEGAELSIDTLQTEIVAATNRIPAP